MGQLKVMNELPEEFLEIDSKEIKKIFSEPTLVYMQGDKSPAIFVSILLHGNEFSGLEVMQMLFKKYKTESGYEFPRSLWLFVGNVDAAAQGARLLDGQIDFNRAWLAKEERDTETAKLIGQVMDTITEDGLFASVDVHNNTGKNPHYGCISVVNNETQYLATLFNHIAMVFTTPKGVSTMAFDEVCPAITLECATPGNVPAKQKAFELIDDLMHLDHFPEKEISEHDLQLVQNSATVKINGDISFEFEDLDKESTHDVSIVKNFEYYNFSSVEPKEVFAYSKVAKPFVVTSTEGEDITDEIIQNDNGEISLKTSFMPAMISMDKKIVRQDCLCYLLEDYEEESIKLC